MSIGITLVGGPADGHDELVPDTPDGMPPSLHLVAVPKPLPVMLALGPGDPFEKAYTVARYAPILEAGWPSLTDDGRYRYAYQGTEPEIHPGQLQPTPSLDELAGMRHDPPRTVYPDTRAHLLACRTRYSLRRDAALSPQEAEVRRQVVMEAVRASLAERKKREPDG